ncbi:hypothetical protein PITC_021940 [Penicillium italicum]|uniref:Uncharacterized protein n=1 Tax=Penicillium italicum TaxID=40296 RepID=A0A0A2L4R4_PENIT|nr:hypothetical protein PITC_021940 [Penicillium italicum]
MGTDDEAEETECESEDVSDEEGVTKKKGIQQRNDDKEDHTPQETVAQRESTPEEQMLRAVTPLSDLTSDHESADDESTDIGEAEGASSKKRKAIEMDNGENETMRTPAAKRANTNRRREPELTAAQRQEQKRIANRRKRERAKRRKALAR